MHLSKEEVEQLTAEAKQHLGRTIVQRVLDRKTRRNVDESFAFRRILDPVAVEGDGEPGFHPPKGELVAKNGMSRELTLRKILNYFAKA